MNVTYDATSTHPPYYSDGFHIDYYLQCSNAVIKHRARRRGVLNIDHDGILLTASCPAGDMRLDIAAHRDARIREFFPRRRSEIEYAMKSWEWHSPTAENFHMTAFGSP